MADSNPPEVDTSIVLRRAAELDKGLADDGVPVSLDPSMLAEVASEVGISPEAMASALAEAKAGAIRKRSVIDKVVGPRWVSANRITSETDDTSTERLVEWLEVAHGLKPRVTSEGLVVASKRRDLAGVVSTSLRRVQGLGGLSAATTVKAAAVTGEGDEDDDITGSVCLVADVGSKRNEAIRNGSVVTVVVWAAIGVAATAAGTVTLVGLPVAAGLGTLVARRSHRTTVVRVSESVDHVADGVALGQDPPRPKGSFGRRRRT